MKTLVLIIMLVALYLLYRIAFPKRRETKQGSEIPQKRETDASEAVVKSRFVRPVQGQPQPTYATPLKTDLQEEKPSIFAGGNEKKDAVIPPGKLDEVFADEPNPEDLDIPPDEDDENDETDLDEEAEEFLQTPGSDAEMADGLTIEEMSETIEAIHNPTDEKAGLLYRMEKTDMFEQLVSGDEGKAARIKAVIDRYIQSRYPEVENVTDDKENDNGNEWKDFDISFYVS